MKTHRGKTERLRGFKWLKLRKRILIRDEYLCQVCKKKNDRVTQAQEVDHIKPLFKGGKDDYDNLQSICKTCHKQKTAEDTGKRIKLQYSVSGYPLVVDEGEGGSKVIE